MNVIIDSKEFKFNISWRWNLQPCKVICKLQVIISKYSPLNCWIKFIWKPKAFWSHRGNETKLKIDRIKLIYLFTRPWSQCFLVYLLFVRLETKSELSRHLVASWIVKDFYYPWSHLLPKSIRYQDFLVIVVRWAVLPGGWGEEIRGFGDVAIFTSEILRFLGSMRWKSPAMLHERITIF